MQKKKTHPSSIQDFGINQNYAYQNNAPANVGQI